MGRRLVIGLLLAAVLGVGAALVAQEAGLLRSVEQRSVATRFAIRGAERPDDLVVVAIDDKTFDDMDQAWPFSRTFHGRVIDRLHAAGVREIVYDVQFTEATTELADSNLYYAIADAGGAVLATTATDDGGGTNVLGGEEMLRPINAVAGAANLPDGVGGVLSHLPYSNGRLTSMAVLAARRAGGPQLSRSQFGGDGAWIDFRGPPGTITTVSFSDVKDGKVDPAVFRGKVVVVGATDPTLQDVHLTPTASEPMAGPEIQANAIWTALHGLPLRDGSALVSLLLVVGLGCLTPLLRLRLRVLPATLVGIVAAGGFLAGAQLAFEDGRIIWVVAPVLALVISTVAMVVASHLAETRVRRRVSRDNDILEAKVLERTQDVRRTQLEVLERLSRAAEWRDEDTGQHVIRIGSLSERLGRAVGLPLRETEMLRHAAVAHDIGKIGIPDRILLKPGRLTPEEREEMERHATIGAAILSESESPMIQLAEAIARTHHERWDGSGYPNGLQGEEIPLVGRICAVVDVFDALVSERPYKRAWSMEEALAELVAKKGQHFDPDLVDAFVAIVEQAYAELYGDEPLPDLVAWDPPLAA